MNVQQLLPKDKYDNSNIEKLRQLTDEEIAPVLPALLEWLKDANWPVFDDVLSVLALHQSALVPLIISILSSDEKDGIWKYWIISRLLPLFSDENIKAVLSSVKRIEENPTEGERTEEVNEIAADFLNSIL